MKVKESAVEAISGRIIDYIKQNKLDPIRKPFKVKNPSNLKNNFDEETFVLAISDCQVGHMTKSFNFEIFKERMAKLVDRTIRITNLHRRSHPVNNLEIFILGDMIHGENIGYTVDQEELEDSVKVQLIDVLLPQMEFCIEEMAKNFKQVRVHCVRGNHGMVGKQNALKTNWDELSYHFLKSRFRDFDNVKFNIADEFGMMVKIYDWRFFLTHGDSIKMFQNIPIYGVINKMVRWQKSIEDFDVMVLGHFHNFSVNSWNGSAVLINGTFVSDDQWVAKTLGLTSSCSQILFSVHPKRKISMIREIYLDD